MKTGQRDEQAYGTPDETDAVGLSHSMKVFPSKLNIQMGKLTAAGDAAVANYLKRVVALICVPISISLKA